MPNIRKRIEILERSLLPIQFMPADDSAIADVLHLLSDEDLDNLIAAGESEREGLPLTAGQMAAQRAFARLIAQARFPDCAAGSKRQLVRADITRPPHMSSMGPE
ncbi:MAG: hypothetical protein M3Y27_24585 [Acidobacteriota bacterium]|nr:hypothetical protein [Acidobacteriota bacterium]